MIRRFSSHSREPDGAANSRREISTEPSVDDSLRKLSEALGAGVEALKDHEIAAKVQTYFEENPNYSRDAVHVAAIACHFKEEKIQTANRQGSGIKL